MNIVFLIGNLTREPEEIKSSDKPFVKLTMAVNSRTDTNKTEYFTILTWGNMATNCIKYLVKGSRIAVQGKIQNRTYEDKNGNKKTITEIIANDIEFLSKN